MHHLVGELPWQHTIAVVMQDFRAVTRPVVTVLFGWVPAIFHWKFPGWLKDYLVMGLISGPAGVRGLIAEREVDGETSGFGLWIFMCLFFFLLWPVAIFGYFYIFFFDRANLAGQKGAKVFFTVFLYALIILLVNLLAIHMGARTGV